MVSLDDELYALVSTLTALSPAVTIPVYAVQGKENPQSTDWPRIIMTCVSAVPEESIVGVNVITASRYSFDCGAVAGRDAKLIADALETLLQGYSGTAIKAISKETHFDIFDADTGPNGTHHRHVDFEVLH